ncbi:uncharacterized protein [Leptinotarsa decemlineata]|uniref:uncharacterized protein n=1 Tax=Leptinotarsa decemlineata TaxID=7539 RepID=UPI003D308381
MREMKKQEFENQIRILDLQKQLAETRIEEEQLCSTRDICSKKSLAESTDKESMFKGVQEWADKCEVHSVTFSPEITKIQNTKVSQENDISKLYRYVADAIRSVSRGNCSNNHAIAKELPFFDGKPEDWPLFISQFNRKTVMYQYSDDEVMLMLQRCLKDEALEAVRSLLLHPKNIIHVIETLEMRFGHPEYVIGSLINKTQNLQFVRDGDFNNFVKFSCHVNNLVATMEQFEASNHLNNLFLLEQLVGKLPNGQKLQWGQKMVLKGADPSDPQCSTPNHLPISSPSENPFPTKFEEQNLRKQWKKSQRLAEIFWSRWIKEYLPTLSKRAKWIKVDEPVAVGDVVVVADDHLPRNTWPLGRIMAVFPGKDNITRVVEVKTSTGVFKRPVTKICRVDVEFGENS